MGARFKQLADEAKSRIREITPAEAQQLQARGGALVDVRETEEFARGHAKGAIHLSKGLVELRIEDFVPDVATPVMCYCGGGSRSALAAENLQRMGYTNVSSVAGGFKAWTDQGLPTE